MTRVSTTLNLAILGQGEVHLERTVSHLYGGYGGLPRIALWDETTYVL